MSFIKIEDPKQIFELKNPEYRNKVIEENLRLRKKLKEKHEQNETIQNEIDNSKVEFFKPIIDSNKKLQNDTMEVQNKIIDTLKKLKIQEKPKLLAIEPSTDKNIIVSRLIANYLQDLSDRSLAGYSMRFDENLKTHYIGKNEITFENNKIKVADRIYNATAGLLELLLKKSPNFELVTAEDKLAYKQILLDSNAYIYI